MIALQILINALIAGSLYSLIAVGFTLLFNTTRFVNFAHGAIVVSGGYFLYFFYAMVHLPFWLACLFAIICASVLGMLTYVVVFNPLAKKNASSVSLLTASIVLLLFLENVFSLIFGFEVKAIHRFASSESLQWHGVYVTHVQVALIGIAIVLLLALFLFVRYTRTGSILRAVADHPELAEQTGIPVDRVRTLSVLIASAFAGVAGIMVSLDQYIQSSMGVHRIVDGFTGSVIGGVTSLPGAVLGSFLLGMTENVGVWFVPSGYKGAISFALLIFFFLFRPAGILGSRKSGSRV